MLTKRLAAILLLIQSILALDTSGLPSCGVTCVTDAIDAQTACAPTDLSCLCADEPLGYAIGYCLGLKCDAIDQTTSLNWIQNLCLGSSSGGTATTTAALFTAVSVDRTATAMPTATASSTSSTFTTAPDSSQKSSGGISTGAKIGIAVGVPVGVLAIIGGVLAAYCFGRRKSSTTTTNVSHVEKQGAIEASQQPPTYVTAPVTAEKVGYETAVTQVNSPHPQPMLQAQSGVTVPVQANEKLGVPPIGQQSYSPQQVAPAVSAVSPVSPYQDAASPLTYSPQPQPQPQLQPQLQPQPQPQPNAYEATGNMATQQSTITQPQFSQVYEAPAESLQYPPSGIPPQGSPPPTNVMHEVPNNAPGVTDVSELPAGQS